MKKKFLITLLFISILSAILTVYAWTNPNQNPPLGGGVLQTDTSGLKIVTTTRITLGNFIVNTGNVGIGTTAPGARLEISGGYLTSGGPRNTNLKFASGGTLPDAAQIYWGDNTGWKLHFGTFDSANTFQPRMTIVDTGNVGIGTTNPQYKLEVNGDVSWSGVLQGGSVPWARLTSFPPGCPSGQFVTAVGGFLTCDPAVTGGGTKNYLAKWIGATSTTVLGDSIIYDNGTNVGIGTTTPTQKLDVAGYVKGHSGLCIGDDCRTSWPSIVTVTASCGSSACAAYCPFGYEVLSGGWDTYWGENIDQNRPTGDNTGWFVFDASYGGGSWTVYARCIKLR
jgi:hypothetical protein